MFEKVPLSEGQALPNGTVAATLKEHSLGPSKTPRNLI